MFDTGLMSQIDAVVKLPNKSWQIIRSFTAMSEQNIENVINYLYIHIQNIFQFFLSLYHTFNRS